MMTVEEITEIRENAAKQAEGATNEQLVYMFERAARLCQAESMGKCTMDGLDLAYTRMYVFRQELMRRLGK